MSLQPHLSTPVPEATARVARAAFPNGNPYLTLRDALGTIFQDDDFAPLFPPCGQPGLPPWRLALVTILQFREHLAIAKPQKPCGHASTGSTCSAWS